MRGKRLSVENADSSDYFNKILRQEDYEDIFSRHNLIADSLVSKSGDEQSVMYFNNYIQVMYRAGFEEKGFLIWTGQNRKPFHPRSLVSLLNGNPLLLIKMEVVIRRQNFFLQGIGHGAKKYPVFYPLTMMIREADSGTAVPLGQIGYICRVKSISRIIFISFLVYCFIPAFAKQPIAAYRVSGLNLPSISKSFISASSP